MWKSFYAVLFAGALATTVHAQRAAPQWRTFLFGGNNRYCVIAPQKQASKGKPARLLVVLPGGDGSADFLPFVRDEVAAQVPEECAVAMMTAVKWRDDQQIVWPTAANPVPDMEYPTEKFVDNVVKQVRGEFHVEPADVAALAWSSSGPVIHGIMAGPEPLLQRAYIAMSIWPDGLDVAAVKGRRYVLDQSPADQTTAFHHVRSAFACLAKAGAVVRLSTYDGGHGWNDQPMPRLRTGLRWLFSDEPAPTPLWPPPKAAKAGGKLVNQLLNGGFEDGTKGWNAIENSKRCKIEVDTKEKVTGKQSLHLSKTGGAPLDLVVQSTELAPGKKITASLQLKSKGVENAWIKVRLFDAAGKEVHEDVNLVQVPPDGKWQACSRDWPANDAVRAAVQILMVGAGELWVDDVVLTVTP